MPSTVASYPLPQDCWASLIEEGAGRYNSSMAPPDDDEPKRISSAPGDPGMGITITPTDLSRRTREIMERVEHGEHTVVSVRGKERVVLLDAFDYRLLRALASCAAVSSRTEPLRESRVLRDYLAETISLGKAAELLEVPRFDLEERLRRLGIPLRLGASSLEDAKAEVAAARRHT